ncbi:MAG: hypothetical protein ABEN55_01985 [Bradymonadaceae bacterium]
MNEPVSDSTETIVEREGDLASLSGIETFDPDERVIPTTCHVCDSSFEIDLIPTGLFAWTAWTCPECGEPVDVVVACSGCGQLNRRRGGWLGLLQHKPRSPDDCQICGTSLDSVTYQNAGSQRSYRLSVAAQYLMEGMVFGMAGAVVGFILIMVTDSAVPALVLMILGVVGGLIDAWNKHRSGLLHLGRLPDYIPEQTRRAIESRQPVGIDDRDS